MFSDLKQKELGDILTTDIISKTEGMNKKNEQISFMVLS